MNDKFYKNYKSYIPIIGLEVHVELKTKSKMFCGCGADYFGKEPNTLCCPVCLGLPGSLPVPNKKAIEWCVMLGLALNCETPAISKFDRKHYFYPDLPKGYQISQYDMPLCVNGWIKIKTTDSGQARMTEEKKIRIRRVHMEEDTAKLIHGGKWGIASLGGDGGNGETLIDFNRSGVPLVEIVTEPDFRNVEEVDVFLKKIQQIVRYLGVSDADMEKGTMRCEPSISIKKTNGQLQFPMSNDQLPKYRVEIKNINSFKFARKAIESEIERQTRIIESGGKVEQETRGWLEKTGTTLPQRRKEEAYDYRYFPEPDVPPIHWTKSQISNFKLQIPELPDAKFSRFVKDYGLSEYDAGILTGSLATAEYFEETVKEIREIEGIKGFEGIKKITNWIINKKLDIKNFSPKKLAETSSQMGQMSQISDVELKKIITEVLKNNKQAVEDYKSGKEQALMFLVGQVMKATKGQTDPATLKVRIQFHLPAGRQALKV